MAPEAVEHRLDTRRAPERVAVLSDNDSVGNTRDTGICA